MSPRSEPRSWQNVDRDLPAGRLSKRGRNARPEWTRAAYLIAFIGSRARAVRLSGKQSIQIPITQQHIADTLGLSLVHTNKTIRKLMDRKLIIWRDGGCEVIDNDGLKQLAGWEGLGEGRRPLI